MNDTQIKLLNKVIASCIDCGGDPGGPYWTDTGDTFEAILDFIRTFREDELAIQYIPFEEFRVYRVKGKE